VWRCVVLCSRLTGLVMSCPPHVSPAASRWGGLTALQQLELVSVDEPQRACLDQCLLPLPPALRMLRVACDCEPPAGVQAALQAAADQQDCTLRLGAVVY
jgi:hypothetical protein